MRKYLSVFFAIVYCLIAVVGCSKDEVKQDETTTAVTDIDGNIYQTVTIGTQTWMLENLKTTKYNDGTMIPNITNTISWSKLTTGAYCNYDNDAANGNKYGHLYNWFAVNTGKLAPKGWHLPSDTEWIVLQKYVSTHLGVSGSVGKAIAATTDWSGSTVIGSIGNDLNKNNSSGFSAKPGGIRGDNGQFGGIGGYGYWWAAAESVSSPWRGLDYEYSNLGSEDSLVKGAGFSVRCIKD